MSARSSVPVFAVLLLVGCASPSVLPQAGSTASPPSSAPSEPRVEKVGETEPAPPIVAAFPRGPAPGSVYVDGGLSWVRAGIRAYDSPAFPARPEDRCASRDPWSRAATVDEVIALANADRTPWTLPDAIDASPWIGIRATDGCVDLQAGTSAKGEGADCGQTVTILCVVF